MTVADLIAALRKMPQTARVFVEAEYDGGYASTTEEAASVRLEPPALHVSGPTTGEYNPEYVVISDQPGRAVS